MRWLKDGPTASGELPRARTSGARGRRAWVAMVAVGAAASALVGCGPEVRATGPASAGSSSAQARLLDPGKGPVAREGKDLEERRLELYWDLYLGERPKGLWLLGDAVYVHTELDRLYAIGLADGLVRWQYNVPEGLMFEPAVYSYGADGLERTDEVLLISKNSLHVVDRQHGYLMWKLELPFPASSPASASVSHIYVGSWDHRIYAISKEDRYIGWTYRTNAPVTAPCEVPERSVESVFLASEDGVLYSLNPGFEQRKWHIETRAPLVAAPLFHANRVLFGSRDMNLYSLRDGLVEWRYPAGAPLVSKPVVYPHDIDLGGRRREEALYVMTEAGELLSVNLRPDVVGKYLRWSFPGVSRIVAHGRGDIYVLGRTGGIVALSEETGEARWEKPLDTGALYYAHNPYSARSRRKEDRDLSTIMAMAFRNGWIAAVKEKGEY